MLKSRWEGVGCEPTMLSVGLDTNFDRISGEMSLFIRREDNLPPVGSTGPLMLSFNKRIIEETKDLVCAYKVNLGFYLAQGFQGHWALQYTVDYIHETAPHVPVILDGKFGDIGVSSSQYAQFAFDVLRADAVTVNPLVGKEDGIDSFLEYKNKGIFILCHTSNKGADNLQNESVLRRNILYGVNRRYLALYERVAQISSRRWNHNVNCGLVVGATHPGELRIVREIVGEDMPILVPGIGEQGGDLAQVVVSGKNSASAGLIINSSRGILYKSSGEDFAQVAREEAVRLRDEINVVRSQKEDE